METPVGGRQAISFALINTLTPFSSPARSVFFPLNLAHRLHHAPNVGALPGFGPIGWDAQLGPAPTLSKENNDVIFQPQSYNFHLLITQRQRWAKYRHLGLERGREAARKEGAPSMAVLRPDEKGGVKRPAWSPVVFCCSWKQPGTREKREEDAKKKGMKGGWLLLQRSSDVTLWLLPAVVVSTEGRRGSTVQDEQHFARCRHWALCWYIWYTSGDRCAREEAQLGVHLTKPGCRLTVALRNSSWKAAACPCLRTSSHDWTHDEKISHLSPKQMSFEFLVISWIYKLSRGSLVVAVPN